MKTNAAASPSAPSLEAQIDDRVWGAVNDASGRRILDLLRASSMTTSEHCGLFAFSRFAVTEHLKVLESAGLVIKAHAEGKPAPE